MRSPKTDERSVPEGEVDTVLRPDTKAPKTVAPHLGDPLPVFHPVEDSDGRPSARARCEVVTDGMRGIGGHQIPKHRLLHLRVHPLFPGRERDAADVVKSL